MNSIGGPTGPVFSVVEALADPQISERGLIQDVPIGDETLKLTGSPVVADDKRPLPKSAPPQLGANNGQIWTELGLPHEHIT